MIKLKCVFVHYALCLFCICLCLVQVSLSESLAKDVEYSSEVLELFKNFTVTYNRQYPTPSEKSKRLRIFAEALKTIKKMNAEEEGTAKYGITKYTDWTEEEYFLQLANLKPEKLVIFANSVVYTPSAQKVPESFDWRDKEAVTPVKTQGKPCGSSWTFATVANIENAYAIKHNTQRNFSVQQLIDCDGTSLGCEGGYIDSGLRSTVDRGGINREEDYPYTAEKGMCRYMKSSNNGRVIGQRRLPNKNETSMRQYIAHECSTINVINAEPNIFRYYLGGIISASESRCSQKQDAARHAVVTVGYGAEKGRQFWITKNSWGADWGENGYARISRGSNTCGIGNYIGSAIVA